MSIEERSLTVEIHPTQHLQLKLAAQVFAQGREAITVTDAQGNYMMVNRAFSEITGYTEAEVLGKTPRILNSGRQSAEFYKTMWETVHAKNHWASEVWNRHKNGTIYPVWLAISAIRDEQGHITNYVGNFSDLSKVKAAETRIQWMSHFDVLTGLPNQTLLQDRTELAITMVERANQPLTMALVAIDQFRAITDTFGHQISDALLVEVAKRLADTVREQDTVARVGGKEFVLVLPGTPATGAAHLAAELLRKLALPYRLGTHELNLTASMGIASYPDNGTDFDTLFKSVEIAVHRAQTTGNGLFQFYSAELSEQVLMRTHMTTALRQAVALDQFELLYQPLADLQTGQVSGLEALLRWKHPEFGAVSPAQFIPIAEQSGLISHIGEWVLRRACRDIRDWQAKGIDVPRVAINVSPLQFRDSDFLILVKHILSELQVDPKRIYIEVTESALMNDVQRSEDMLHALKSIGFKLALDDFGTGYSSLSYLKRFPFDKVKIDQSFVRDVCNNQSDQVLVKVIVSMAHGLGLTVIAEGVETEAQCEIMRTSMCDEIQGYFFSQPISAQATAEFFQDGRKLPPHLLRIKKTQRTLLLVDDEPNIVAALKRLFRRDGHTILTANSGAEGLEVLLRNKVDVIISDQRMPGMTGVEFLRAAKSSYPDTIRIVLSGYTELQSVTDAINEGSVYRFLTKPWEDDNLREHIQKAFEYKALLEENQQLDLKIRTTNQELLATNRQLSEVLQHTRNQTERNETSLAITREALQHIPIPVIGVDDEGLMAFVNAAAEDLFAGLGPLLGVELAYTLPTLDAAIQGTKEGAPCDVLIDGVSYCARWNTMGLNSPARGKLLTVNPKDST